MHAHSTQGLSRAQTWAALQSQKTWDVCVVGGGATGLGVALDAAARGYSVVLAEAEDFASGASSRSSKMLHGGVRYLQQLDFALVKEALAERATVLANAPHVAQVLPFVIPCPTVAHAAFYGGGLKLYDALAGARNVAASGYLSAHAVAAQAPPLKTCTHGIQYFDGLFDDARLAQSIARTAREHGAMLMNYCRAEEQTPSTARSSAHSSTISNSSLLLTRQDNGETHALSARCTIFATGAWSGERVAISRGSHIVVKNLGLQSGVLIPKTPDGRVLYMLPWLGHTLIGTTDIAVAAPDYPSSAPEEDIEWLLHTANLSLGQALRAEDVRASFVGYRPLVRKKQSAAGLSQSSKSSQFSRSHVVERAGPQSLRVIGGKWTTYRRMAEDCLDMAVAQGLLPQAAACRTQNLPLSANPLLDQAWQHQGQWSDEQLCALVHSAVREEAACSPEDILYRRLRTGFTNQALAQSLTDKVAQYLAVI